MKKIAVLFACLLAAKALAITPFMNELLNRPNGLSGRAWLGVTNGQNAFVAGTNITFVTLPSGLILISAGGLPGSGTVTSFSAGTLSPLFTTSVATATTTPALSFSLSTHTANTVFSGPSSGGAAAPTFRSLVAGDIPALDYVSSTTVRSDNTFLGGPASGGPLAPTFRTIALDDLSDVTITSVALGDIIAWSGSAWTNGAPTGGGGGGGGTNGIDITLTAVSPTAGTNFDLDFQYPAQVFNATGSITFNSAINAGSGSSTSRVANVFIQATNYARKVYFLNESTNWNIVNPTYTIPCSYGAQFRCQAYGGNSSNVTVSFFVDEKGNTNMSPAFVPTSVTGIKLWIEPIAGMYQDFSRTVAAQDNMEVRAWTDISGVGNHLTNNTAPAMDNRYASARTAPFNIPCLRNLSGFSAGNNKLTTATFSALAQVNWCFIVYYSSHGGNATFDGVTSARMSCSCSFAASSLQLFCGSSLTTLSPTQRKWMLFSFKGNGANSIIRTNGVQAVTGNAGTGAPVGFTVGADNAGAAITTPYYIAEILFYNADLSNGDRDSIEEYLRAKYALW